MTQEQFDALINYINAKIALSERRVKGDWVVEMYKRAERVCVKPDHQVTQD